MAAPDSPPVDWPGLRAWLDRHFPDVAIVDAADLARMLRSASPPLLIDVRMPAEQDVSTIPGALRVAPSVDPHDVVERAGERTIVVYCSVGVRSARLARALAAAGGADVRNLVGGIFGWANAGRPLAGPNGPAQRVHGYDAAWSVLLDAHLRA